MLKPVLAFLLLVVALCAAGSPAVSVTLPWAEEEEAAASRLAVDLGAVSRAVALASAQGFKGLQAGRQESGRSKIVALLRTALRKAPWLGDGRAQGLWTWQRNPALGVAVYGPGIGGYSSFSWTRQRDPANGLDAAAKLRPLTQQELLLQKYGRGGGPVPVPLPPAAPMLLAAIGITILLRRRRGSGGNGASRQT